MPRRVLYRRKVQFSLRTLLMAMATVPALVYCVKWLATFPLAGLAGVAIGLSVAVFAFRWCLGLSAQIGLAAGATP